MLFLIYAEAKMSSSSDDDTRAAPTRKRFIRSSNGDKRNSDTPKLAPETDDIADEVMKEVTGKRFSITQLFRKKSKRGSTGDIAQDQETVTNTQNNTVNTSQDLKMDTAKKLVDDRKAPTENIGES